MALFDLITKTIQADDWSFQVIETESVIALDITLESGQFRCYFLVDEETECVQFHTVLPVNVPLKKTECCLRIYLSGELCFAHRPSRY